MNKTEPIYGSFATVEVPKATLLEVLQENKEKHNLLYQYSVSGYYDKVKEYRSGLAAYALEHSQKNQKIVEDYKAYAERVVQPRQPEHGKPVEVEGFPNTHFKVETPFPNTPKFPVSFEDSYNQAIRKLELSIHENFRLSEQEFQQYVMNNWSWRTEFLGVSSSYLNGTRYLTGCLRTGSGLNSISVSGCLLNF